MMFISFVIVIVLFNWHYVAYITLWLWSLIRMDSPGFRIPGTPSVRKSAETPIMDNNSILLTPLPQASSTIDLNNRTRHVHRLFWMLLLSVAVFIRHTWDWLTIGTRDPTVESSLATDWLTGAKTVTLIVESAESNRLNRLNRRRCSSLMLNRPPAAVALHLLCGTLIGVNWLQMRSSN